MQVPYMLVIENWEVCVPQQYMCTCTFIGIAPLDFDFPAASMLLESVYLLQEMILKKTCVNFPKVIWYVAQKVASGHVLSWSGI